MLCAWVCVAAIGVCVFRAQLRLRTFYFGDRIMSKNIFAVTGATGNKSGGAFTDILYKNYSEIMKNINCEKVRFLVRPESKVEKLCKFSDDAQICVGDMDDLEFLKHGLNNVDILLHICGINYSRKIVDAAVFCGVRRLVLVHTTGIYSKYKSAGEEYRQIDKYVEKKCAENGIILTILRPTMIYGNLHDKNIIQFIKMADRLPIVPIVSGAHYRLQPVHYEDLADAYYSVLMNEKATANKNFDLSGGQEIELRDIFLQSGKMLGKKVKFLSMPLWLAYSGAVGIFVLTFGKADYREKVQRLCETRVYSHKDAADTFGYKPRSFIEGLKQEIDQYIKNT